MGKYPKIVAKAREVAKETGKAHIVFHNRECGSYEYATEEVFGYICQTVPVIRMLLCLPNGAVVQ